MSQNKTPIKAKIILEADSIIIEYIKIVQNTCNMFAFITSNLNDIPFDEIPKPPIISNIKLGDIDYVGDKKNYLDMWLFNHGMNDIIKAINISLGLANYLAEITSLNKTNIKYGEYIEFEKRLNKKYLKKDLPALIDLTSKLVNKPLIYVEEIKSINDVRKCHEHRSGIVTEIDTNSNDGEIPNLKMKWIGNQLSYERNGDEFIIYKTGVSLDKGDLLKLSNIKKSKSFEIGERIRTDINTFYELAWTGFLFIKHIADNFNFGKR
ncbi:MAG TPA: hypothetical protein VGA80_15240 [Flavobacteriaceae bacterium]